MTPHEIKAYFSTRHSSVVNVLQFFADSHLHPDLKKIVTPIRELAFNAVEATTDGADLVVALRKLVEVKDNLCRHHLVVHNFKLTPQTPQLDVTKSL